jgi:hypothetical protein
VSPATDPADPPLHLLDPAKGPGFALCGARDRDSDAGPTVAIRTTPHANDVTCRDCAAPASARDPRVRDRRAPSVEEQVQATRAGAMRAATGEPVAEKERIARALQLRQGVKFDFGKLRYCLEPTYSRECLVRVFTVGSYKYEDWNWLKGMDWTRIVEAMERHLADWKKGIPLDPETALRQLGQVAWGCYVLLEYERLGVGRDDRKMPTRYADVSAAKVEMDKHLAKARAALDDSRKRKGDETPEEAAAADRETAKAQEKVARLEAGSAEMAELLATLPLPPPRLSPPPAPAPSLPTVIAGLEALKNAVAEGGDFEHATELRDALDRLKKCRPTKET